MISLIREGSTTKGWAHRFATALAGLRPSAGYAVFGLRLAPANARKST
jgi:hypothetical protein